MTVGRPQVVTKTIDGVINEPMENTTIDVPEEYMGTVTQPVSYTHLDVYKRQALFNPRMDVHTVIQHTDFENLDICLLYTSNL